MIGEIKIDHDCLIVLHRTLLAVAPEEGCALMLGEQTVTPESMGYICQHIRFIWPCCNVWGNRKLHFWNTTKKDKEYPRKEASKQNRFLIDPREQIHAQRWARKHNWAVLGTCHSHLQGEPIPSKTDIEWSNAYELSLIHI